MECDREAKRIVRMMPNWVPAQVKKKSALDVSFTENLLIRYLIIEKRSEIKKLAHNYVRAFTLFKIINLVSQSSF